MSVLSALERRAEPTAPATVDGDARRSPWIAIVFAVFGCIGAFAVVVDVVLGVLLAVVVATVAGLAWIHRDEAPLWHHLLVAVRYRLNRLRGDDPSPGPELRPWPHVAKLPAALAGTELLDADYPAHGRCGVVWHRPTGLTSSTVLLEPSALLLTDPGVAETYTSCWWSLLDDAGLRPEVRAAAVTVDVHPGGAPQAPVRLTLTVDPGVRDTVASVADAAALTVRALSGVDAAAAGLAVLRPATAEDLARIARDAFEPGSGLEQSDEEPPAWGELSPASEAELAKTYQHERYTSMSFAMHAAPGRRLSAEAVPHLLMPGIYARRVTLVRRQPSACSVFVTVSVADPDDLTAARAELESLVRTTQPRLELCRDLQAEAFGVGLPAGWFPPHPVGVPAVVKQ